jgi:hypothetical protein
MSMQIQRRRGTTSQHASFTGAVGEVTVDTDKKVLVVHDALTAGGTPLAKEAVLSAHTGDQTNPHSVTAAQAGADPAGTASSAVAGHASGVNVHAIASVTGLQAELDALAGGDPVDDLELLLWLGI